jgi:hypothetical protein
MEGRKKKSKNKKKREEGGTLSTSSGPFFPPFNPPRPGRGWRGEATKELEDGTNTTRQENKEEEEEEEEGKNQKWWKNKPSPPHHPFGRCGEEEGRSLGVTHTHVRHTARVPGRTDPPPHPVHPKNTNVFQGGGSGWNWMGTGVIDATLRATIGGGLEPMMPRGRPHSFTPPTPPIHKEGKTIRERKKYRFFSNSLLSYTCYKFDMNIISSSFLCTIRTK